MRVAVVGGGLAGCAAALDLVESGYDVTVLEARPTLGGAVQTLPERPGDPEPPPDNGQHIALGCFTEYLHFLDRIGESGSYRRERLALPVIGEAGDSAEIKPSFGALLGYTHLALRDRVRIPVVTARCHAARPRAAETFGALLRRLGASDAAVERFWDVFIRPALNLRADDADAAAGLFVVRTALLGRRESSDLILPRRPLGAMHGEAARRTLEANGATVQTGARVTDLADVDADAVVVAVPPPESAQLLGEPERALEDSPIVSVHLLFDRPLLRRPLAALLGSDAHWVFDRGSLTAHTPERGQYLTVVSSGVPELMELRGRDLVARLARQVTARLGAAELLWSRVSREPRATVALRPGAGRLRPGSATSRPNVVRAGAWTDTGWPVTMESAVRSGRAAARTLAGLPSKVAV
ncbi:MAG TPA: hydroxysqualene dehydroxylase HpnE [Gaiellaceae bacterium]|nr:hydroxysqualene dehydroxylase HpnE [Gaiellaceae bacterium]